MEDWEDSVVQEKETSCKIGGRGYVVFKYPYQLSRGDKAWDRKGCGKEARPVKDRPNRELIEGLSQDARIREWKIARKKSYIPMVEVRMEQP